MTLQECLQAVRARWIVVVLAAVLGLGVAAAVGIGRPAEYTATTRMYVAAQSGDSAGAAAQGGELAAQRVVFYTELVQSTRVTRDVVQQLGLPVSAEELASQIVATPDAESVFFDLAVTGSTPESAATVVNAVSRSLVAVVREVETANSPNGLPLVGVEVLEEAAVPTAPSSTGQLLTLVLGLLTGVAAGIALALARAGLDPSIRSPEHLARTAGAPVLCTIAKDARIPGQPLPAHDDARGPIAEEFRRLRTNLRVSERGSSASMIVVTSPMPGAGKTTTVLNLGIALALAGERVLVIEADLRRPVMAGILGLPDTAGLGGVLRGRAQPGQAIQEWKGLLHVLACGPPPANPSELLASWRMRDVLDEVRGDFDVVLIDTPPLLPVADAAAIAPAADGALLVCRYKQTTQLHVQSAVEALRVVSVPVLGAVLMMVPDAMSPAYSKDSSRYRGGSVVAAEAVPAESRRTRAVRPNAGPAAEPAAPPAGGDEPRPRFTPPTVADIGSEPVLQPRRTVRPPYDEAVGPIPLQRPPHPRVPSQAVPSQAVPSQAVPSQAAPGGPRHSTAGGPPRAPGQQPWYRPDEDGSRPGRRRRPETAEQASGRRRLPDPPTERYRTLPSP